MRKYIPISLAAASLLALVSCNDFLDELPDNRSNTESPQKVQELLGTAYPEALYMEIAETMSDNSGDKEALSESSVFNTDMYFWRNNNEALVYDRPTFYWNQSYTAIASANQALASINKLGGGSSLNYLKGEALV